MGTDTPSQPPGTATRPASLPHRWERVEMPTAIAVVDAHRTVIAGAGPAGLTAAYELTKNGHECVVLESEASLVGGISRTDQYKGYRFDIGGHRFFSKSAEVNALWREILGENQFLTRPRLSRIYYDRKFFHYPLKPVDAFRKLGPIRSARILASYLLARLRVRSAPSAALRTGSSTASDACSSRSSSRPTPRKSGGCPPRPSPPTGPPSASRA